jgi:hypothetical protein
MKEKLLSNINFLDFVAHDLLQQTASFIFCYKALFRGFQTSYVLLQKIK